MRNAHQAWLDALPTDWDRAPLGKLGSIHGGTTPSRGIPSYWGGEIPWVAPGELTNLRTKYLCDTADHITLAGLTSSSLTLLPKDTLLVTTRATLGSVALAAMPMTTNQGFRSLVFNGNSDPNYYYYLVSTLVPELVRRASGTTFLEISGRQFSSIEVPAPPRPEQRKIADILDTADTAIRYTEATIAKMQKMNQGLLHDLLTRGIDDNGELRDPVRHPELFQDSPLGRIPKGWEVRQCESVCEEIVVGIVIRPTQYYRSDGIPVLRSANVRDDGLDLSDLAYMSTRNHRMLQKSAVSPGTVVTVRTGYPGTTCVIPDTLAEANCVDLIISRLGEAVTPEYLAMWVNSPFGSGQVLRQQGGLAQQHFNIGEMKKLLLAVPHRDEQARMVTAHSAVVWQVRDHAAELSKLRVLKEGLMDDLLAGRVRVAV